MTTKKEKKPFAHEIQIHHMVDIDPDISYLKQDYRDITDTVEREKYLSQDRKRLDEYYDGYWHMIGISAVAIVYIPEKGNNFKIQEIDSGGLWGIESDSGKEDIDEIEKEQIDILKGYLSQLNIKIPKKINIVYKEG